VKRDVQRNDTAENGIREQNYIVVWCKGLSNELSRFFIREKYYERSYNFT
jgi:hypothetical protein